MRVFVAGASGAVGTRLVRQLIERGHEAVGTSRSPEKAELLRAAGAEPIVLDLLDRDAVRQAVVKARPDGIVHEATALAGMSDIKHFDRSFGLTNRLRTEGTDALLAGAREAGVRLFVAQSYATPELEDRTRNANIRTRAALVTSFPVRASPSETAFSASPVSS